MNDMRVGKKLTLLALSALLAMGLLLAAALLQWPAIAMIIIVAAGALIVIALAASANSTVAEPVNELLRAAEDAAKGSFNVNLRSHGSQAQDGFSRLENAFGDLLGTLNRFSNDLNTLPNGAFIDTKPYTGVFREWSEKINLKMRSGSEALDETLKYAETLAKGDFSAKLRAFSGKDARINEVMESLRSAISGFCADLNGITENISSGKLTARTDSARYTGEWARVLANADNMAVAVSSPVNDAAALISAFAKGDFSKRMNGNYKGEFNNLKETLNSAAAEYSRCISEITAVLKEISNDNLNTELRGEFSGKFAEVKEFIEKILNHLNEVMESISAASSYVADGSKSISGSSMTLAEGTTMQAASVQQLTATVEHVQAQTTRNTENAAKAEHLSELSKENAAKGNKEMQNMLGAMQGIKDSSDNISRIIKVISDIAFQTNLLALNASVEAARAGEHGKGFAVVAEEVRTLAGRSREAADNTTALIEQSIEKVNQGSHIAVTTAQSLEKIITDIDEVSHIISDIAAASQQQSVAISQISIGTNQIAEVVQRNVSMSEQTASAAEELGSQSDVLRETINTFTLRRSAGTGYSKPEPGNGSNTLIMDYPKPMPAERAVLDKKSMTAPESKPKTAVEFKPSPKPAPTSKPKAAVEFKPSAKPAPASTPKATVEFKPSVKPAPAQTTSSSKPASKPALANTTPKPAPKPAVEKPVQKPDTKPVSATVPAKPAAQALNTAYLRPSLPPADQSKPKPTRAKATLEIAKTDTSQQFINAPSASSVYDRKDFGKY